MVKKLKKTRFALVKTLYRIALLCLNREKTFQNSRLEVNWCYFFSEIEVFDWATLSRVLTSKERVWPVLGSPAEGEDEAALDQDRLQ